MSELSEFFEGIQNIGVERRKKLEERRNKLLEQPHLFFNEGDIQYITWRGKNCISIAQLLPNKKIDLSSFQQFSFNFLDALNNTRENGKVVNPS